MNAIDLRAVLADPRLGGAHFVDAGATAAFAAAGTALDFAVVRIDLDGCVGDAALFARFAEALRFPAWFGHNWDALADSLGDLSWWPARGYLLLIERSGGWRAAAGGQAATLLEVLDATAAAWAAQGVAFWAVLPVPTAELAVLAPDT